MCQISRPQLIEDAQVIYKAAISARDKLRNRVRKAALIPLEGRYLNQVQKAVLVWQGQWNQIAGKVGRVLYSIAQREILSENKNFLSLSENKNSFIFPEEIDSTIIKTMYEIPPEMRTPIQSVFTVTPYVTGLVQASYEHLRDVYIRSVQSMGKQLGIDIPFSLRDPSILQAFDQRANLLAGSVSDTTFNRLKHRVATSYMQGKHPTLRTVHPVTGARLTSVAEDISGFFEGQMRRAKMVARTETLVAQSAAEFDYNQRVGIKKHGWMTSGASTVRAAHVQNNGAVVILGKPFPDGQLRVGEGPAELVVNCECSNYPVPPPPGQLTPWDGGKVPGFKGSSLPMLPKK